MQNWYGDNTLGEPTDFQHRYGPRKLRTWAKQRDAMNTIMLPASWLANPERFNDRWLRDRFVSAHAGHTELSLMLVGAMHGGQIGMQRLEIAAMQRIRDLGLAPTSVIFQSALSKPDTTVPEDIHNVCMYTKRIVAEFPTMKLGIIDASPVKVQEWQSDIGELFAAMADQDSPLSMVIVDNMKKIDRANWDQVVEFVKDNRADIGIICTHKRGGKTSAAVFRERLARTVKAFLAKGYCADIFLTTTWTPYPNTSLANEEEPGMLDCFQDVVDAVSERFPSASLQA